MAKHLNIVGMVRELQCPGCAYGPEPARCEKYTLKGEQPWGQFCAGHIASTFVSGIGRIALGLPKGFNRLGTGPGADEPKTVIRLYPDGKTPPWDKFNIAVWKLLQQDFLYVRTYAPRTNRTFVDVAQGGALDAPGLEHAIDVGPFYDEMD